MPIWLLILFAALVTACISGIFGMAGGMIFMGVIATFLGVSEAMVVHGAIQSVSNSHRFYLLRQHARWDILKFIALGAVPATGLLALAAYVPEKGVLFLILGLLPLLLWLPRGWFHGDAEKPLHAVLCGIVVMALNLVAGVAGPALDIFFVRTNLTRQEIVATKAVTMLASHMVKIGYFGIPLLMTVGASGLPPLWFFVAAIPCVMMGTFVGTRLLLRMSDVNFRSYTKYLVTIVGCVYVWRGVSLLGWV